MTPVAIIVLLSILAFVMLVTGIPAYAIGTRRRVPSPGVAFVPIIGPWIVMLRSIGSSGWVVVPMYIPLVGIFVSIWFLFAMPTRHHRTKFWALFLLVPILGLWLYAFTLQRDTRPREIGLAGYHIPPGAVPNRSRRR